MLAKKCTYLWTCRHVSSQLLAQQVSVYTLAEPGDKAQYTWESAPTCPSHASQSYGLALCLCTLGLEAAAVPELGNLTFPSAPSSTPSRPMISFRLMAPADCLPPSNFRSLGRTSQEKMLLCVSQRMAITAWHSHADKNDLKWSVWWGDHSLLLGGCWRCSREHLSVSPSPSPSITFL